ncbi:arylesterase [Nonlabens spongiae]|uniref:arylesterase n=1 Tax=Nonlabens spongiae TaxID=331648 RepID=UPI001FE69E51|nr:arylesterase [Nonlabens spongiae]
MAFLIFIGCKQQSSQDGPNQNQETAEQDSQNNSSQVEGSGTILFFGDSITAGYGLDDTDDAFPGLIQQKIDSLGMNYEVVNSGVSGETTAGGKSRIDWVMNQKVDIFILELGANDGLRGVPVSETKSNLQEIINTIKDKSPDTQIILAGMQLPPNLGKEYTTDFKNVFPELAQKNDIDLIPFILKDVGGIAALNQNDGIHPTEEGHQIIADTVWETLRPLLDSE